MYYVKVACLLLSISNWSCQKYQIQTQMQDPVRKYQFCLLTDKRVSSLPKPVNRKSCLVPKTWLTVFYQPRVDWINPETSNDVKTSNDGKKEQSLLDNLSCICFNALILSEQHLEFSWTSALIHYSYSYRQNSLWNLTIIKRWKCISKQVIKNIKSNKK